MDEFIVLRVLFQITLFLVLDFNFDFELGLTLDATNAFFIHLYAYTLHTGNDVFPMCIVTISSCYHFSLKFSQ